MSLCECNYRHPLKREGTTQLQRLVAALDPSSAKVDDRSIEDLLLFAKAYAKKIRYYGPASESGNESWEELFSSDPIVIIAEIAIYPIAKTKTDFDALVKDNFDTCFITTSDLLKTLQTWGKGNIESLYLTKDIQIGLSEAFNYISFDKYQELSRLTDQSLKKTYLSNFFDILWHTVEGLQHNIERYMSQVLEEHPYHRPHYALFLTFLQLFRYAQDQLNTITARHLDFYYKEVLQIKPKDAIPDKVHVIFELAKSFDSCRVEKGNLLKAGKDNLGKNLFYSLERDLIVNKAQVISLKTIHCSEKGIYASPVADSLDGEGKKPESGELMWSTFGEEQYVELANGSSERKNTMPAAEIGFAVASPLFFMKQGERNITLTFTIQNPGGLSGYNINHFEFFISTEKEWLKLTDNSYDLYPLNEVSLKFSIAIDQPPITTFKTSDPIFPGMNKAPVLRAMVIPEHYSKYKEVTFSELKIGVDVKTTNLQISNDFGKLDHTKMFLPFGPVPEVGNSLYIYNEDLGHKTIQSSNIVCQFLEVSGRTNLTKDNLSISSKGINVEYKELNNVIKITLNTDLGVKTYPRDLAKYLQKLANEPSLPYIPKINSIELHYTTQPAFTINEDKFYHITPFGIQDINISISTFLFPQIKSVPINGKPELIQGTLLIGLDSISVPQNISLLFQCTEDSGDPTVKYPDKVYWFYLSNNEWIEFKKSQILFDSTKNFKSSGIIEFSLPSSATSDNTLMPPGKVWIMAAVKYGAEAVSKMVSIRAQADLATFTDQGNDPRHLDLPLPATTITRLEDSITEIKSVIQPYASFGGRKAEDALQFYTRVSERLRHKQRGISLWDMERLVLEKFPSVYKVKCINHAGWYNETDTSEGKYSEMLPGHVTIIVLGNQRNHNVRNIFRPAVSISLLEDIHNYIRPCISPFVQLHVKNPMYEEVGMNFNVKLNADVDKGFYLQQLKTDIVRYLSPWAFDEGKEIFFGGKLHQSAVINFIDGLGYVDYLKDFVMKKNNISTEEASATNEACILVAGEVNISD